MTSENLAEHEAVESAAAVSAKAVDDRLIDELVHQAQFEGQQLTGEGGPPQGLTKQLMESALNGEITDHLGYDKRHACTVAAMRWRRYMASSTLRCRPADRPSPAALPRKCYSAGTKSPDNVQVEHWQRLGDFRPSSNTVARLADVAADLDRRP